MRSGRPGRLWRLAEKKDSRLVLALDIYDSPFSRGKPSPEVRNRILRRAIRLLEQLEEVAVGVKIGFPLTFCVGVDGLAEILSSFSDMYYFLADFKLSDIPRVNEFVLRSLRDIGFDGAVVQIFQGGIEEARRKIDLFAVVMMSHPGAKLFEGTFRILLEEAKKAGVEGLIVGATKPSFIKEARREMPNATILSPGVVAQGAKPSEALLQGSDFEIVGRAIVYSKDPAGTAASIVEAERNAIHG